MTKDERIAELEREVEKLEKEKALDNSFWKQECDGLQKTVAENYKLQNQKAIECLKKCRYFIVNLLIGNYDRTLAIICEYIDTKIKELEGE